MLVGTLVNVVTNFSINVCVYSLKYNIAPEHYRLWVFPLEAAVVFIEFFAMSFWTDKKTKLFFVVMFANALSYFAGVVLFGSC